VVFYFWTTFFWIFFESRLQRASEGATPARWLLWDVVLASANLLSRLGAVEKILASRRLAVVLVLDLDPGGRIRRVPGACLLRDNPSMSCSQITWNSSVPLAT
jgi:hypothetical protein